jgi:Ca2+-binding EF-hand superfamily protein
MRIPFLHTVRLASQLAAACSVALAQPPSIASAQGNAANAIAGFHAIDTDGDAKLDRRELTAAAGRDFDRLDLDRDDFLTRSELAKTRSTSLLLPFPGRFGSAAAFAAADTDRDGKIDKHEYEAAVVRAYLACDRNHDGTIELSDLRHCGE